MSSIENGIQAVINNDISKLPNVEHCSRVELFLRHMLDSNTPIPKPLSRIEKMLYSIVNGNNILDNNATNTFKSGALFDSSKKDVESNIFTSDDTPNGVALLAQIVGFYPINYETSPDLVKLRMMEICTYLEGSTSYFLNKDTIIYNIEPTYFYTNENDSLYDPIIANYLENNPINLAFENYEDEIMEMEERLANELISEDEYVDYVVNLAKEFDNMPCFCILMNNDHVVESISLPNIKYIPLMACYLSGMLKRFDAPKALSVGSNAFMYDLSLEEVDISSCKDIGNSAFANDPNLRNVKMPNVERIGANAFSQDYLLTELDINKCEIIGCNAFSVYMNNKLNPMLTKVNASSCSYLASRAFANHVNLVEAHFGPIWFMASDALYECTNLKNLTFGDISDRCNSLYLNYSSKYTTESLHNIIEHLPDKTGSHVPGTLKIGLSNIEKIDVEHISMLHAKNWDYS